MGRGGLLQFLNASLSSCRRYRPARASRRVSQSAAIHVAFTPEQWVRPLGLGFRGHLCVHSRYVPMTCSPSLGWLCRSTPCASFPPRMRSWLQGSDFYPGGSTSHWTHQTSPGHTVRLLPSEPLVVMQPKFTIEGADIVMQLTGHQPWETVLFSDIDSSSGFDFLPSCSVQFQ